MVSCIVIVCGKSSGEHGLVSIVLQLRNQSYKNIEIIPIVCCIKNIAFLKKMLGNRIYKFTHKYFASASRDAFYEKANYGLKMAIGEYIGFFSGDDYYSRDYLEKMVSCIEHHKADFVYCNFRSHFNHNRECDASIAQGHITSGCFIVRVDATKNIGGFQLAGMGDFDFAYRIRENGYKIVKIDEMLYVHR